MNWTRYEVSVQEFKELKKNNKPILIKDSLLTPNSGVEVFTNDGSMINAVYDANLNAIRLMNEYNPQFTKMPNRDLILFNDHLLNKNITTIIADGFMGTGKTSTVCSHLVEGLTRQLNNKPDAIPVAFITKPHEPLGKTNGHLPGELIDKTFFEFQSFTQYFDRFGQPFLADKLMCVGEDNPKTGSKKGTKKLETPILHILVFEYLRGRNIDEGWVVLDEAQNTNVSEVSSFISRGEDKAKMIIMGDSTPTQIDKRGNSCDSNGLTFAKETYIGKKYAGYVEMQTVSHILRGQRTRDLFLKLRGQI